MHIDSPKLKIARKIIHISMVSVLFLTSFIYLGMGLVSASENVEKVNAYFETEEIICDRVDIPTQDNSHIATYIYMQEDVYDYDNHSVPVILFAPGANNLKSNHFFKHYNLVKANYSVVAVEQRGHGESGGFFSFYNHEAQDLSDIIDYLELHYPQLNTTHVGLIGMSLGGGATLLAQALDNRIYASTIYHPVSNTSGFFSLVPAQYYLGFTPGIQPRSPIPFGFHDWSSLLKDAWTGNNPIDYLTEANTKNLLLLHGSLDTTVNPGFSEAIIEKTNGDMRDDVELVIRDGLTHVGNEGDSTSFKYVMSWLNHFYFNATIDITNLDVEKDYIQFVPDNFPSLANVRNSFFMFAGLLLAAIFLTSTFFFMKSQYRKEQESKNPPSNVEIRPDSRDSCLKLIGVRSFVIIISLVGSGFYSALLNPSLFYGLLYYPLFIAVPGLLLIPSTLFNKSVDLNRNLSKIAILKHHLKNELQRLVSKRNMMTYIINVVIYVTPVVLYIALYNLSASQTIQAPIVMWNDATVFLVSIVIFIPSVPLLFMRDIPEKYAIILFPVYFVSSYLFTLFVPVISPPIFPLPVPNLLISVVFALIAFVFYIMARFGQLLWQKFTYQNVVASLTFLSVILSMLIFMRVMRIF